MDYSLVGYVGFFFFFFSSVGLRSKTVFRSWVAKDVNCPASLQSALRVAHARYRLQNMAKLAAADATPLCLKKIWSLGAFPGRSRTSLTPSHRRDAIYWVEFVSPCSSLLLLLWEHIFNFHFRFWSSARTMFDLAYRREMQFSFFLLLVQCVDIEEEK